MVMCDYESNTNGKKIKTKDKTEPQHLSLKQTHHKGGANETLPALDVFTLCINTFIRGVKNKP